MRYLTPDAAELDALFQRCYERRPTGFGAPTWQLVALPAPGAMSDQDARTMEALAWIRDVRNRLEQDVFVAEMKRPQPVERELVDG